MESSTDKTRKNLRKRLDQLGYRLYLGIDSVPLVAKLFSDLVHTTVSLRNAKLSAEKQDVPSKPPCSTWLGAGDHFQSQVSGGKKPSVVLIDQSTQTDEERRPSPRQEEVDEGEQEEDLSERVVELQEELLRVQSDLVDSHGRLEASDVELSELREAKRTLERSLASKEEALSSKDDALAQMVALKEHVFNMAYRKLSASKEVILGQQEIIRDLEVNLRKIKAEVSGRSPIQKQLAEAKGRNHKLQGLVSILEGKSTREELDDVLDIDRDVQLHADQMRAKGGGGDCGSSFIKSREEDRLCYRREAQRYKSILGGRALNAVNLSPSQARRAKFVLAATFRGDAR
ncbi:uncharacterized protein LOC130919307 [Corythoichthys intestinalis]|uniref:uncharacterized protein LOC130919307 n=1 Tax=Corythoichthys intestinalis TaxID=161448 RepID=UPI0025A68BE9|nr:uncharacterized protein LOC130919307 [Corythoichthys intestinalis]